MTPISADSVFKLIERIYPGAGSVTITEYLRPESPVWLKLVDPYPLREIGRLVDSGVAAVQFRFIRHGRECKPDYTVRELLPPSMAGYCFHNIKQVAAAVASARNEAKREAEVLRSDGFSFFRSRGTTIATAAGGEQDGPLPAAEANRWDGTWRDIVKTIDLVIAKYPTIDLVYLEGGFDAAEYFEGFKDFNYEPHVSNWTVDLWRRPQ